ncbi:MAG: class I SAM-dependent methyltransferase [Candidatus Hydrogenedentes bacterium]|nr:class I SAM-dependent methyltransferase [Candidatus Hydrogenedentota bacterium]
MISDRIYDIIQEAHRRARHVLFEKLVSKLPRPVQVLDVGGTEAYWDRVGLTAGGSLNVTLLNPVSPKVRRLGFVGIVGDGRAMSCFEDQRFDVVFSNSVIEHVGGIADQHRMAREIRRVGKRYIVQTPNKYFPIEPHFYPCPLFQFFPLWAQVLVIRQFRLRFSSGGFDRETAEAIAKSVRLLSEHEFRSLFPDAVIEKERLFGLVKSFTALGGWDLGTEYALSQRTNEKTHREKALEEGSL